MGVSKTGACREMISTFTELSKGSLKLFSCMPFLFCLSWHLLAVRNASVIRKPNSIIKELSPENYWVDILNQSLIFQTFSNVSNTVSLILMEKCLPSVRSRQMFRQFSGSAQFRFLHAMNVNYLRYLVQSVNVFALPNSK